MARYAEGLRLDFRPAPATGRLIVVEGASCAGKSTLITRLTRRFDDAVTVEWNSHPWVRPCVDRLKAERALTPVSHLLTGLLDHRVTLDTVVLPALRAGRTVVSDRYLFTAVVRDGLRGVPADLFRSLAPCYPAPHTVLLVGVGQEERMRRYRERRSSYGPYACGQDLFPDLTPEAAFERYTALQEAAYQQLGAANHFTVYEPGGPLDSVDANGPTDAADVPGLAGSGARRPSATLPLAPMERV
jgi:dTMP kinase